ncbi:unnamed protein product, partial [Prorocentrum cordatum]
MSRLEEALRVTREPTAKHVAIGPTFTRREVPGSRARRRASVRQASLRDLPPAFWPSSAAVDALGAQAAKLRREGVAHPYASPDLKARSICARLRGATRWSARKAFLPFWASGKAPGAEADPSEAGAQKGLLPFNQWHATFDAHAAAAAILGDQPSFMSLWCHKHHTLQVAARANSLNERPHLALHFDAVARRSRAERSRAEGKGGQASDRRGDLCPAAGSAASGHRGGWVNRGSWHAGNQSVGKSEWPSKGGRKGKRGNSAAPKTPEKRGKRSRGVARCFTKGAPIIGALPSTGNGIPVLGEGACPDVAALRSGAVAHNQKILKSMRESEGASALLEKTREDASLGRMSRPISFPPSATAAEIAQVSGDDARLLPRFPAAQCKPDGSVKIRPVDDGNRAGIAEATLPGGKLVVDGLDRVIAACRAFFEANGVAPALWRVDIDAAYRRIPLAPGHAFAAWSAFLADGRLWVSQHFVRPFGASGSVYGGGRVAAFLRHAVRRLLRIPAGRYVDDHFAPEAAESVAHAAEVFARMARAILGPGSVAGGKLEWGSELVVLGVHFALSGAGIHCAPSEDKARKWACAITRALESGKLEPGAASKLAGALSWASQSLFKRLGRASLRPLFAQQRGCGSRVRTPLRIALEWWREVLDAGVHEVAEWKARPLGAAHLFADARSTPPRASAVLFARDRVWYTDWAPGAAVLRLFGQRGDNQIMSLGLLAIAVATSSFRHLLSNAAPDFFSDSRGAEQAVARGSACHFDCTCLARGVWALAAEISASVRVHRVPSAANIADPPSREDYGLVRRMDATYVEPTLDNRFYAP